MAEATIDIAELAKQNEPAETKQEFKPKEGVRVVTSENLDAFVDSELERIGKTRADAAKTADQLKAEAAEEENAEPSADGKPKKNKLNERFSELTAARKAAEEKASKAAEELAKLQAEKDNLARERDRLKAQYEPPASNEPEPEPDPEKFTDSGEYLTAIKKWAANEAIRQTRVEQQKAAEETRRRELAESWTKRVSAYAQETPDFQQTIQSASQDAKVSDEIRDAILESDYGPQILYHLAKNLDLVNEINKMDAKRALRRFGRLEAQFANDKPPQTPAKTSIASISKAPPPIVPVDKEGSAPIVSLTGKDSVPTTWNFEDFKRARKAGQIK